MLRQRINAYTDEMLAVAHQFTASSGSLHVPFDERSPGSFVQDLQGSESGAIALKSSKPIIVVCRRGNDSQLVVQILQNHFAKDAKDLQGGLLSLAEFDPTLPVL